MTKSLLFLSVLLTSQLRAFATVENITGDWLGTIHAGQAELRLALHIQSAGAAYTGSLDSIDQGAKDISVARIVLEGSKLTFEVPAVNGSYQGTVKGDAITGQWTQGQSISLDFHRGALGPQTERKPGKPSDIDGAWLGKLNESLDSLRVQIHITNMEDGLSATLDSLDQGATGIPVGAITRDGAIFKFELKALGASFEGKIDENRQAIDGTFTQMGKSSPLKLTRVHP